MTESDATEHCSLLAARAHGGDVQASLDHEAMRLLIDELPMIARTTSYPLTSPSYRGSVDPIHEYDRDYLGGYETDTLPAASAKNNDDDCVSLCLSLADQQLHEPEPEAMEELRKSLALMYPIVLTYVLEYIPGLVCIVLVGHMDSPDTKRLVDAATLSTMFTNVSALSVGFGLLTALDTLCSQAHGANRQRQIGLYLQCAVLVIGACLLPIFLVNWHSGYLLALLGQDPEVARLAGEFSRITMFGIPFLFVYEMCRKLLQAQNVVKPLAYFAVVGNLINIVAGYVLTYHTSLGFHGAALSRTLGYMALPLCLSVYFAWSRVYEAWWPGWQPRTALKYARLFLKLGVPGFLMMGMEWWAYELMAIFAGNLKNGVVAVSAHAVLMNVASSSYMLFLGISVAGNIRVGNCLGANLPKKARLIAKLTLSMVMAGSMLVGVAVYYLRFQIPKVVINDPVATSRAAQALQIMAVYVVVDATNCVVQGIYRGAGWQHLAARNNLLAYYALGLPLGVLLAFKCAFGIEGLWIGFSAGMVTTLAVCCSILYQADWEQLAIDARARIAH